MSKKSAKKAAPQIPPSPRHKDVINKEYEGVCLQIGDRQVKLKGLEWELTQLYQKVQSLGNELNAWEQQQAVAQQAVKSATDSSLPLPSEQNDAGLAQASGAV